MLFKCKKHILLALCMALIPVSTVYPWSWASFSTSFSTAVGQIWNKACYTLAEVSPRAVAVGTVLTAGVLAGLYWFKKSKKIERRRFGSASGGRVKPVRFAKSSIDSENASHSDAEERAYSERIRVERQSKECKESDSLEASEDESWTLVEFLTPDAVEKRIVSLKESFEQLYKVTSDLCSVDQLSNKSKHELIEIKNNLAANKQDLAAKKANLHQIICVRTGEVSQLHDCLNEEYEANRNAMFRKADFGLFPYEYYSYLNIEQTDGFTKSSEKIMEIIAERQRDLSESHPGQWILRQLGYTFGTPASKEHLDAFLQGRDALQQLLFKQVDAKRLSEAFASIEDSQMPLEEYLSTISNCLRKLSEDSNGKKPEEDAGFEKVD